MNNTCFKSMYEQEKKDHEYTKKELELIRRMNKQLIKALNENKD